MLINLRNALTAGKRKPNNLWVWPTQMTYVSLKPSTVWNPQLAMWYGGIADNGYGKESIYPQRTFTSSSYHNWNQGGYSMVQFFAIPSGSYNLSFDFACQLFTDTPDLYLMPYSAVEGGYKKAANLSRQFTVVSHDDYKTGNVVFTMPNTSQILGIYISGKNADNRRGCDIWNVLLLPSA